MLGTRLSALGVGIAGTMIVFAGCSGNATGISQSMQLPQIANSATQNRIASSSWRRYINPEAQTSNTTVWVVISGGAQPVFKYQLSTGANNPPPTCQSPAALNQADGAAVDAKGQLWLANDVSEQGSAYLQAYNCKGPVGKEIADPYGEPYSVSFDTKGNIYVANYVTYTPSGCCANGAVTAFTPNGRLIGALSDPSLLWATGVAVDHHNNCFVAGHTIAPLNTILEYPGCNPATSGIAVTGPKVFSIGVPQFDSKDNMIITDSVKQNRWVVEIYAPPYIGAAKRVVQIPTCNPQYYVLDQNETHLYAGNNCPGGGIDVYTYPGIKYLYSFNNSIAQQRVSGVAVFPRHRL